MMLCFESKENDFKLKTVTGSQCSWWRMAVMRCQGLVRVRTLAAEFCTYCSLLSNFAETPKRRGIAVVYSGGYEGGDMKRVESIMTTRFLSSEVVVVKIMRMDK